MYETLVDHIKGEIEEKTLKNNNIFIKGWSFSEKFGVSPVRCKFDGTVKSVEICTRRDICEKFNKNSVILCGWTFELPINKYADIQVKFENNWYTILSFNTHIKQEQEQIPKNEIINPVQNDSSLDELISQAISDFKIKNPDVEFSHTKTAILNLSLHKNIKQNVIIIDNFYEVPESVREIGQLLNPPLNLTHSDKHFKPIFEKYLGVELDTFNKYETENIFLSTNADTPILINTKDYEYGAIVFLTPNAPVNTGITLYRSKHTNKMIVSESEKTTVFQNGNQDITEFEPVDIIGNVYNRLVIFNTQLIHAITHNFGKNFNNNRFVQMFAFDTKKSDSDTTKISFNL